MVATESRSGSLESPARPFLRAGEVGDRGAAVEAAETERGLVHWQPLFAQKSQGQDRLETGRGSPYEPRRWALYSIARHSLRASLAARAFPSNEHASQAHSNPNLDCSSARRSLRFASRRP